jgi:exopolysaccharide production protein ExoZ
MSIKKINSIQLLRAIAVSLVIFIHAATFGVVRISSINPVEGIYNSQTWGAIGVDLFFCISGFIMTIVVPSYQEKNDWKKFQLKRVIRILPLYYLLSALDALATVFIKHQ